MRFEIYELQNRVTKSNDKKMMSHADLLTQNWKYENFHFELLTRELNFCFSTLKLQTRT